MNERDKELAIAAGLAKPYVSKTRCESGVVIKDIDALQKFADLIRADEREAIAQMFEGAPALVPFAQNDKGGCMICGFTPRLAMEAIRARSPS